MTKDLYRIKFIYPDGKIEYFQEFPLKKPFDSGKNANLFYEEDAIKIKEKYMSNPYGKYMDIDLEEVGKITEI